jgi:hypothetical protein
MKVYLQKQKEVFEVILEQEERKAAAAKAEKAKASTAKDCRTGTVAVAAKESDVSGSWFPFFGGSIDDDGNNNASSPAQEFAASAAAAASAEAEAEAEASTGEADEEDEADGVVADEAALELFAACFPPGTPLHMRHQAVKLRRFLESVWSKLEKNKAGGLSEQESLDPRGLAAALREVGCYITKAGAAEVLKTARLLQLQQQQQQQQQDSGAGAGDGKKATTGGQKRPQQPQQQHEGASSARTACGGGGSCGSGGSGGAVDDPLLLSAVLASSHLYTRGDRSVFVRGASFREFVFILYSAVTDWSLLEPEPGHFSFAVNSTATKRRSKRGNRTRTTKTTEQQQQQQQQQQGGGALPVRRKKQTRTTMVMMSRAALNDEAPHENGTAATTNNGSNGEDAAFLETPGLLSRVRRIRRFFVLLLETKPPSLVVDIVFRIFFVPLYATFIGIMLVLLNETDYYRTPEGQAKGLFSRLFS